MSDTIADARMRLLSGGVIPAQPLALDSSRRFDERHQRALVRYHIEAGASGLAVAVHSSQFSIHDRHRNLLSPLLELVSETTGEYDKPPFLVAGVTGDTATATRTAALAAELGYDFALLSSYGCGGLEEQELLERARAVSEILPVIGFYLQPAVGGQYLSQDYWQRLAEIQGIVGIKVAPFDRYATLDVLHGLARSGRAEDIALYTGNDDNIIFDLLSEFPTRDRAGEPVRLSFRGGLLGQWAVWTRAAVHTLELTRRAKEGDDDALREALEMSQALTDANSAIFDARHDFRGVIPGVHEVLRRHGLLGGTWLLDENEVLSPGQAEEIDRIWDAYPFLRDDTFIAEHLDRWLN